MCRLKGGVYCEPCFCDDYRGAVKAKVHAKSLREHRENDRICREENEAFCRDESASLKTHGYRRIETNEEIEGEVLYAAGDEWVLE